MYCKSCGRKLNHAVRCICLSRSPLNRLEICLLFAIMVFLPVLAYSNTEGAFIRYFKNITLYFSGFLLTISIASVIRKRSYTAFIFGCHQYISRTLKHSERSISICSRCAGIYIGIIFSILWVHLDVSLYYFLLLSIPMLMDGMLQCKTSYESNNSIRLITGFLSAPTILLTYSAFWYGLCNVLLFIT